jgi:ATP-dependent Clp protease ATP-binding subunit ClpX
MAGIPSVKMGGDARCSFCGKSYREVGPLVEGQGPEGFGGVFICRADVELCRTAFEQQDALRAEERKYPEGEDV